MIRVLIVDDQALVRAGLRMILERADDIEVVGEAGDGEDALDGASAAASRRGPDGRPDAAARRPRGDPACSPAPTRPPKVIMLTTFDLDDFVFAALQGGASGFLLKHAPAADLLHAVRVVAAGEALLSP